MKAPTRFVILLLLAWVALLPGLLGMYGYWTFVAPYGHGVPYVTKDGRHVINNHGKLYQVDRAVYDEAQSRLHQVLIGGGITFVLFIAALGWYLVSERRATEQRRHGSSPP